MWLYGIFTLNCIIPALSNHCHTNGILTEHCTSFAQLRSQHIQVHLGGIEASNRRSFSTYVLLTGYCSRLWHNGVAIDYSVFFVGNLLLLWETLLYIFFLGSVKRASGKQLSLYNAIT